jgi:biopolymer transport protein ExbD
MKLKRPPRRAAPETIIALIDVVFFLLVFFLLVGRMDASAPFDVLPAFAQNGDILPGEGVTISISETGEFAVNGRGVPQNSVQDVVRGHMAQTESHLIRINADRETEVRDVLPMLSTLEALDPSQIVLIVTPSNEL